MLNNQMVNPPVLDCLGKSWQAIPAGSTLRHSAIWALAGSGGRALHLPPPEINPGRTLGKL